LTPARLTAARWVALAAAIVLVATAGITSAVVLVRSRRPAVPLPRSMASAGDSITRAFDLDSGHVLQDSPAASWSTGSDPTVDSQYDRLVAANPALAGKAFNDALTGAKMSALAGQLALAAAQRVDYVTILMGSNDLCTPSVATMTPTTTFERQFDQALAAFSAADRSAHVFVASIPDLFRLWQTLRTNPVAQVTWSLARICPSMLSVSATAAERQQVVAQELADNATLASVCARYPHCRFDADAVYQSPFSAADVSPVDSFHPSLAGQTALAQVTWAAGFWPSKG
jgi:lysophospholipase L1-like esterase